MKKRQNPIMKVWQQVTNADYNEILALRSAYYAGVHNDETRLACKFYQRYRKLVRMKTVHNDVVEL